MKLIYTLHCRHAYKMDWARFRYQYYIDQGFQLEIWSFVNWTYEGKCILAPADADDSDVVKYIDNEKMLKDQLYRLKKGGEKCIFVNYAYDEYDMTFLKMNRAVKNAGFMFINLGISLEIEHARKKYPMKKRYAISHEGVRFLRMVLKLVKSVGNKDINFENRKKAMNAIARFWGPILYRSAFNLPLTNMSWYFFPNFYEGYFRKRNVLAHTSDYDTAINTNKYEADFEYAVYVDQFDTGHSDFIKSGMKFPIMDAEKYYRRLNVLFSEVEKVFHCKVLIAAHPKAEYKGNEFDGREILHGKTASLIKSAKIVLIEYSTSYSYVILFHKNFIHVSTHEKAKNVPDIGIENERVDNFFGCKMLDYYDDDNIKAVSSYLYQCNEQKYEEYKSMFVIDKNADYRDCIVPQIVISELSKRGYLDNESHRD